MPHDAYQGKIEVLDGKPVLKPGELASFKIRVTNASGYPWPVKALNGNEPAALVSLSYHLYKKNNGADALAVWEGYRNAFTQEMPPGSSVELDAKVLAPKDPGNYEIRWDLVHETMAWFSEPGGFGKNQTISTLFKVK